MSGRVMMRGMAVAGLSVSLVAGCSGAQSALAPAGYEAGRIATLFWWMAAGAIVVWAGVIGLGLIYGRPHGASVSRRRDQWLIAGGGVALPLVVLTGVLIYGLRLLPPLVARAPEGSLQVHVAGEQWWWRVRYERPGQAPVIAANEIRLPAGRPVQFTLTSDNVIHAFWIPSLAGKMDMIPGRTTRLALTPGKTGLFAGACAEYCGTSHAFMRFMVAVVEPDAFEAWLSDQARPARPPAAPAAIRGANVLLESGCGACHTVRGTAADGVTGPDLTHVGSRHTLAAGTLATSAETFRQWLSRAPAIKPDVHMPAFGMLPAEDLEALAAYLEGLR